MPEIEGQKDEALRLEDKGRDAGGAYEPCNQSTASRKPTPPSKPTTKK